MEAIADAGGASCGNRRSEARALGLYQRRRPVETVLYQLVQERLETFLALADDPTGPCARVRGAGFPQVPGLWHSGPRFRACALQRLRSRLPDRLLVQGTLPARRAIPGAW